MEKKTCSAGRSAPAQTSCRRRGMVDGPLRQSGTETRYPWGNHQPGEVRDTSCAAFRCRSPGSSGKPGDLPVGAVINRPPHRGPDGHRRADRGGSSVIKNNLPALGTAGGWDIRWRNKRGILPAQMLCILRQVRWSGFPRLWQPIDSIVALQSATPHFRAAKTKGFPSSFASGERRSFNHFRQDMRLPKIPRPRRLGRRSPVTDVTGGRGRSRGSLLPLERINTSGRPSRGPGDPDRPPGSPAARTPPCRPRATRSRSRRSWSWAAP